MRTTAFHFLDNLFQSVAFRIQLPAAVYFSFLFLIDHTPHGKYTIQLDDHHADWIGIQPGNKKHTLKNIKNRDAVHPYSRKAQQLQRVIMRKNKLTQKKGDRTATNSRGMLLLYERDTKG